MMQRGSRQYSLRQIWGILISGGIKPSIPTLKKWPPAFGNSLNAGSKKTKGCIFGVKQVKYKRRIKFISSPEYLSRVSEAYKREPWQQDGLYAYMNCDLLVLDDFGSEKRGEWQDQELFRLIDYRMNHGKLLIVTSNLPISELKCDTRISDRLNRLCIPLQFPEESIRAKKAEEENRSFIQAILQSE